jgi:DNA-directed RNA polymerase I subunit RPA1
MQANNACLTSEVTSVSFASLTSRDIRQISVLKIFNPELFDSLNRPNAGGLYDTRLGPLERGDICATCRLSSMDCPGHFGHIDLPVPVMHTLFIRHLYDLVRGMCVYCHHLKLSKFDVGRRCLLPSPCLTRARP